MRMALLQLGFADVYHMIELIEENPKDDDLWVEAYQAKFEGKGKKWGRKEWDALLGHCMASSSPSTTAPTNTTRTNTSQKGRHRPPRDLLLRRSHCRLPRRKSNT